MKLARDKTKKQIPIDLQSMVECHEEPFLVIDADYQVLAVNEAYEKKYALPRDEVVGQPCYRAHHNSDTPCHESGEDCPHATLFESGNGGTCFHIHHDNDYRMCQVKVTAYPIRGSNGELYLGEMVQQLSEPEVRHRHGVRMVGKATPFLVCLEQLKMVAAGNVPVLLQGETGTGKELAAYFIHRNSPRREQPFLTVDCAALTEWMFEAELFGHARGAGCGGSLDEKVGLFEQAAGGTLFLDDLGKLSRSQQTRLQRVLETGQYHRVGGRNSRITDVRIVCASNEDLWGKVTSGHFREDLFSRIACMSVRIPPLRDRLDDIALLAENLLEPVSHAMQREFSLTDDAIAALKQYQYPGNVRELSIILSVAARDCIDSEINGALVRTVTGHLSRSREGAVHTAVDNPQQDSSGTPQNKPAATLHDIEARYIKELLDQHQHNRKQVAAVLGVCERTLYRKLKRYSLT